MTDLNYAGVLDLAPGGLVLTAVLIVWRRDLRSIVWLLAAQGLALAAIPMILGVHSHDWELVGIGLALFALRAVVLPWLLARALGAEKHEQREATPLISTTASLLIAAVLTVVALAVTRPIVDLDSSAAVSAVP
ncbi:hypothetical protein MSHO_55940 [Mycobacterium shottsii]|uniref:Uncharacterized protein n=1 Tax=Mycobacterium shottsii TaxID=133549 RepID=A0A7I7LLQ2_9MYCO|nr:hypothetical protein MSHO_55940 [Mycobacterium shottsii]